MGIQPDTYKNDFELNNGDPRIDPSLAIERQLSIKQQKLKGTYKEEQKTNDQKFKLSLDGLTVEENKDKKASDGGDSWRTDKDMEDEEQVAAKVLKEQTESEDYKKAQAVWNSVVKKVSDGTNQINEGEKPKLEDPQKVDSKKEEEAGEAKDKKEESDPKN